MLRAQVLPARLPGCPPGSRPAACFVATPIQLISTDFDGTIFVETECPPVAPDLVAQLRELQEQGTWWVVNTGRDLASVSAGLEQADLDISPDYLVVVEREIFVREAGEFVALREWNDQCTADHERLFGQVRRDIPKLAAWVRSRFDAMVYADPWSPFCLLARRTQDAETVHAYLEEYCCRVPELTVVRNDVYARFSHVAYSKGTALGEIGRRLGVPPAGVLAAGDHLNDLPMLRRERADWLVAPANAVPAVKAAVRLQGGYVSDRPHGYGVGEGLARARAATGPAGGGRPPRIAAANV